MSHGKKSLIFSTSLKPAGTFEALQDLCAKAGHRGTRPRLGIESRWSVFQVEDFTRNGGPFWGDDYGGLLGRMGIIPGLVS